MRADLDGNGDFQAGRWGSHLKFEINVGVRVRDGNGELDVR